MTTPTVHGPYRQQLFLAESHLVSISAIFERLPGWIGWMRGRDGHDCPKITLGDEDEAHIYRSHMLHERYGNVLH